MYFGSARPRHHGHDGWSRQQAADRLEDVGDNGEASGGVDDADEGILQELSRGLSFEDEHRTEEACKVARRDPPGSRS